MRLGERAPRADDALGDARHRGEVRPCDLVRRKTAPGAKGERDARGLPPASAGCVGGAAFPGRAGWWGPPPFRGFGVRASSNALVHRDLADLKNPALIGCPFEPLQCLVDRAHLPQPVPGNELLALRERPVDDPALLAVELDPLALRARGETARSDDHARLDELLVELLVRRHRLRRRWGRRLAPLALFRQDENTHLCHLSLHRIRDPYGWDDLGSHLHIERARTFSTCAGNVGLRNRPNVVSSWS